MKIGSSRFNGNYSPSPIVLVSLLAIFISLIGKCEAQNAFIVTITPIIIVAGIILCFCFCVCCACICHAKQRVTNASKHSQSTEISYNTHAPYEGADYPQRHSLQGYVPPSARVLYSAQDENEQNSSQANTSTVATSEPVPLPEATLHQGDAPPGYEEALRMTIMVDEPQQQQDN